MLKSRSLSKSMTRRAKWIEEEEMELASLHRDVGNKWVTISKRLPGRSDCEVKNHWFSTLRSISACKARTFLWIYAKMVETVAEEFRARDEVFKLAVAEALSSAGAALPGILQLSDPPVGPPVTACTEQTLAPATAALQQRNDPLAPALQPSNATLQLRDATLQLSDARLSPSLATATAAATPIIVDLSESKARVHETMPTQRVLDLDLSIQEPVHPLVRIRTPQRMGLAPSPPVIPCSTDTTSPCQVGSPVSPLSDGCESAAAANLLSEDISDYMVMMMLAEQSDGSEDWLGPSWGRASQGQNHWTSSASPLADCNSQINLRELGPSSPAVRQLDTSDPISIQDSEFMSLCQNLSHDPNSTRTLTLCSGQFRPFQLPQGWQELSQKQPSQQHREPCQEQPCQQPSQQQPCQEQLSPLQLLQQYREPFQEQLSAFQLFQQCMETSQEQLSAFQLRQIHMEPPQKQLRLVPDFLTVGEEHKTEPIPDTVPSLTHCPSTRHRASAHSPSLRLTQSMGMLHTTLLLAPSLVALPRKRCRVHPFSRSPSQHDSQTNLLNRASVDNMAPFSALARSNSSCCSASQLGATGHDSSHLDGVIGCVDVASIPSQQLNNDVAPAVYPYQLLLAASAWGTFPTEGAVWHSLPVHNSAPHAASGWSGEETKIPSGVIPDDLLLEAGMSCTQ